MNSTKQISVDEYKQLAKQGRVGSKRDVTLTGEFELFVEKMQNASRVKDIITREFRFEPSRRWKFDYALPEYRIAVEIEGGVFKGMKDKCPVCKRIDGGRHNRGRGFIDDCEKYNRATVLGWKVFRIADKSHLKEVEDYIFALIPWNREKYRNTK